MIYTKKQLEVMTNNEVGMIASVIQCGNYTKFPCDSWEHCGELIDELDSLPQVSYERTEGEGFYIQYDGGCDSISLDSICIKGKTEHKRAVVIVYILVKQSS